METAIRDLAMFRRCYDLPTTHDYMALLAATDQAGVGLCITQREQAAVARLRQEGFDGSTLGEAYQWWLSLSRDEHGSACAATDHEHGACAASDREHGACHCH